MTKKDTTNIEYLVNLEVMTIKQAQVYVEEKTGMRSSMFYECVRPLLNPKPIAQNFRTNRPAHLVVRKEEVDKEIAKMKSRII
ncbi:hypothetical protein [Rhodohalobacter halophilus]|uniref:hypothetical protein n=1 Tax=Rhodohalobacter halophilus TaxID=1812810 RepID=UPI00083FA4D3|nr:hypothetical protein [Rhodohalobacter halophilus]